MMTKSATTLKDIALECGVSEATVSYVINGKQRLSPKTREKVMRVMQEMNYHPNAVARGLSMKRLHMLGVFFGRIDPALCIQDPYMTGILAGAMTYAQTKGFNIALFTEQWGNPEQTALTLRDGRTDGILALVPTLDWPVLEGLAASGIPIVTVSGEQKPGISVVDVDSQTGARLATEHLISLGHQRIAYLSGPENVVCFEPRYVGFCEAMMAAGLEVVPELVHDSGFQRGLSCTRTSMMLQLPEPPTAIFAANDSMALGALEAARQAGVKVPDDLSIIGFDDIPAASITVPPLTTIKQPLQAIGEKAASLLIERIYHPDTVTPAQPILLAPELIVRDSTGPRSTATRKK